jgi:hypothetical protein
LANTATAPEQQETSYLSKHMALWQWNNSANNTTLLGLASDCGADTAGTTTTIGSSVLQCTLNGWQQLAVHPRQHKATTST